MESVEDNKRNPHIVTAQKIVDHHHFIIKYNSEDVRERFVNLVKSLIKMYELKDFYVEERKAFLNNRILYNQKTLTNDINISTEQLLNKFERYVEI